MRSTYLLRCCRTLIVLTDERALVMLTDQRGLLLLLVRAQVQLTQRLRNVLMLLLHVLMLTLLLLTDRRYRVLFVRHCGGLLRHCGGLLLHCSRLLLRCNLRLLLWCKSRRQLILLANRRLLHVRRHQCWTYAVMMMVVVGMRMSGARTADKMIVLLLLRGDRLALLDGLRLALFDGGLLALHEGRLFMRDSCGLAAYLLA